MPPKSPKLLVPAPQVPIRAGRASGPFGSMTRLARPSRQRYEDWLGQDAEKWHDGGRFHTVTAGNLLCTLWTQPRTYIDRMSNQGSGRDFFRARARESIERGLRALEAGDIPFGGWERLHLTAAIDEFRSGHFESALLAAERIVDRRLNRRPFRGHFSQEKSLQEYRAEFEPLKK
jgi:hypothetical protein